jgi:hypothetical protein
MILFFRTLSHFASPLNIPAIAISALAVACACPCPAQGTHLWTQSRIDDFEKGTPQGVAITSDGHLRQGPGSKEVLTTPSTFVWSVAVDKDGVAYLGTGSPATVLRVGKDGKPFTLFESKDLSVQAMKLGPDGALYAATVPGGKVFRLNPAANEKQDDTNAKVVFNAAMLAGGEPEGKSSDNKTDDAKPDSISHYIWDLTFDNAGRLYIATGGPGAVYRVDPSKPAAAPEEFFKSDEQHIRALAWDAKGNLIAGSDGTGLVYRINPQGKGYVLFESPRREITAVAVSANGTIYASTVGDKGHNPLPPLPVQGVGTVTITVVQPGSLQAANTSTSLPEGSEIYALADQQAPRRIWAGKDEIVYALAARSDGLLALTGNRGRIFLIDGNGDFSDVAHLDSQQGLCLAAEPGGESAGIVVGTGNTGKLYRLGASDTHEYASDILDAGALARYGRIEVEPGSTGYELFTRTGNVEQPVRGWSDWEPLKEGSVASPAGRFLQWKAVLGTGGLVGNVGVNYLPVNSAPVIDDLVVVPGARLNPQPAPPAQPQTVTIALPSANQGSTVTFDAGAANAALTAIKDRTAVTVRWAAHDDNGDDMIYSLFLRGDGETVWRLLKDQITDKAYTFDATLIPDGGYQIKVVASDAPSHTPGEALTGEKIGERFEIDTTPPSIVDLKAEKAVCKTASCPQKFHVTFEAEDAMSPIAHAEYSLDAGPWQFVDPVGQLSDSRRERYDFEATAPAGSKESEHLITVRAYDRHDNVGLAKTVIDSGK